MTAFARIITIGRNDQLPKVVRLPFGVGVDGCTFSAPVTIQPDEGVCPDCSGFGYMPYTDGAPTCERCDGGGIITLEDTDISAGDECLPSAEIEGPVVMTVAGPSPSSGMTPDARAAGGLRHSLSAGTKTHPPKGVPSDISASHSPAVPPQLTPPGVFLDTFTVLCGLTVFGFIAWFFLVMA